MDRYIDFRATNIDIVSWNYINPPCDRPQTKCGAIQTDFLENDCAMSETLNLLQTRRSVLAINMSEPGPSTDEIDLLLRVGSRVPDHGKLAPWRYVLFEGDARAEFGAVLKQAFVEDFPDADDERIAFEENRFLRAPVIVAVISTAGPHVKVPEWEQILSAGAVCQTILVAATAMGYASQWLTEWYGYDRRVCAALGLAEDERVAGFIYVGTAKEPPTERARPEISDISTRWAPSV